MISSLLMLFACGGEPTVGPPPDARAKRKGKRKGKKGKKGKRKGKGKKAKAADEEEALRALGYLDGVEDPDDERKGVTVNEQSEVQEGYRLFSHRRPCVVKLVELDGNEVRTWTVPDCDRLSTAEMLPGGDVVATGVDMTPATLRHAQQPVDEDRFLIRLNWDGSVRWKSQITAHHDVRRGPDGSLITLTISTRDVPAISTESPVRDDQITRVDAKTGKVLESVSIYDLLSTADDFSWRKPRAARRTRDRIDLIHANTVEWVDHPKLVGKGPLYDPDNIVLTSRRQNLVAIIDWSEKKVIWSWGPGEISAPHGGMVLKNGNVLLFDNGFKRKASRVLEVDPKTREIVWKYEADEPTSFFSKSHGYNQRLANGNTLITNSGSGQLWEVTPKGRIVWEYFGTEQSPANGRRATINQAKHIAAKRVEKLLK